MKKRKSEQMKESKVLRNLVRRSDLPIRQHKINVGMVMPTYFLLPFTLVPHPDPATRAYSVTRPRPCGGSTGIPCMAREQVQHHLSKCTILSNNPTTPS